ncbi:MAG: hypothetical protein ICV79_22420, partial [Flavisolibacter sp.]|nr:hypothetical protein [Flavisolibacter sp.]
MVTLTGYDRVSNLSGVYQGFPFQQKAYTLRNRISYTRFFDQLSHSYTVQNGDTLDTPNTVALTSGIEYSYDIHGNVDSLLNIYGIGSPMVAHGYNRFKVIAYHYDLISGKVNEVHYQPGFADEWYHRYEYDADNRLTDVYSTDTKATLGQSGLEEHEAHYEYYKHGPLARAVLGHQQVQGVDYAYTLQGWLKGVNSTSLNPAVDLG